jgi:uncharacterized protein (TIGR03437 family)
MEEFPAFAIHAAAAFLLLGSSLYGQAVYVPNYTTSNVSGYLMDSSTGGLTPIPGMPVKTGTSPVQALIHPSGKFLYVLDSGSGDLALYAISSPSGALSVIGCPHCDALSPSGMAIDPAGQLLFVTNLEPGTVTTYTVNPLTGELNRGVPVTTGQNSRPVQPVVDPSGRYLYVADSNTSQVSGFLINGGALTPMAGSPFAAGSGPSSVAASLTKVFVANQTTGDISVYQVGPEGGLAPLGVPVPTGGSPTSVAVDPAGNYVYVANQLQLVVFNTMSNGPYPLTLVRSYNAGLTPSFVAVEPDGNFVYVVSPGSNDVSGFAVSTGGALNPIGAASSFGGVGPRLLTVRHIGDKTAISLSVGSPPASAPYGTAVSIRGAVRDIVKPAIVPLGSVTITVNGSTIANGTVSLDSAGGFNLVFDASTQYLPVGSNLIQIAYNPGPGFEVPTPVQAFVTVTKAPTSLTILPPANPLAEQPVTIGVSVPQTGGRYPSGSVTVSVDGVVAAPAAALINGAASISYTPHAGDHTITAAYGGDSYFAAAGAGPVAFRTKRATTTVVTSSSTSLVHGQSPVFTATVGAGGGAVTGTVDFFADGTKINTAPVPVSAGQAQFGSYAVSAGNHAITAQYNGDTNNLASNNNAAPLLLTVSRASVQVSAPFSSGNAVYGVMTFSVAVSVIAPGGGVPGGTIALNDGSATVATTTLAGGAATFSVTTLAVGSHTLTAVYAGDSNYSPATSTALSLTVAKGTPGLTLTSNPSSPLVSGQTTVLTATLAACPSATGTVTFYESTASISPNPVRVTGGQAQFTYAPHGTGAHRLSATYSGDSNCGAADTSGSPLILTVQQSAPSIALRVSSSPIPYGQPLAFTAIVSAVTPASGTPSGNVIFKDGPLVFARATLTDGTATLTNSTMAVGSHVISAEYGGDTDFTASTTAVLVMEVDKAPTITNLTVSQTAATTALTASVSSSGTNIPVGSVQFFNGTSLLGTAALSYSAGVASATLSVGAQAGTVTAAYTGSGNFQSSTSQPVSLTLVPKVATSLAMKVNPTPAIMGQPVTFTFNLSWAGGSFPDGVIQLYDDVRLIGSVSAAAQATLTATFGLGSHNLLATYTGNAAFLPSSARYLLAVNRNGVSVVLSADAATAVFGQNVTLTAMVAKPAAATVAAPTGKVDFFEGATALVSAPLVNGSAIAVLPVLEIGTHHITSVYSGDTNWDSVASNPLDVTVTKAATAIEITAAAGSAGQGEITLTANLAVKSPGAGAPTGTVVFAESITNQVLAMVQFTGARATASLPAGIGPKAIIAVYHGDNRFMDSSSASAGQFSVLNAASYRSTDLAPDQMVTVFTPGLTSETIAAATLPLPAALGGLSVILTDSTGSIHRTSLIYVSPGQLSFLVPPDVAPGPASLRIECPGGTAMSAAVRIGSVSPGIFAAAANGQGVAAAQILRVHRDGSQSPPENVAAYDPAGKTWYAVPVDRSSPDDELYLVLYATGIRNHSAPVTVTINGQVCASEYAGPHPTYPGLDQVNVHLPAGAFDAGTATVQLTADGIASNTVTILLQ